MKCTCNEVPDGQTGTGQCPLHGYTITINHEENTKEES